jgi:hypothetical protein
MRSLSFSKIKVALDSVAHFEHGQLIRCDIGAKLVERSELECLSNQVNYN